MRSRKLVIYGNGHMARTFLHFARLEFEVAGFTVDRAALTAPELESLPVVPFEEVERHFPPREHFMITAVGFARMNRLRLQKHAEAKARGYAFASYLHSSVERHPGLQFGENCVVLDHVALHPGTRMGHSNFLCSNISLGHGCVLGDGCWINSGVAVGGETHIGSRTVLGINATLGDNITIGEGCYIGANTLVARSTGPDEVHVSATGERFPMPSEAFLDFIGRRT